MPRHARLDSPGTLHHVMVRGIEQRQISMMRQTARILCDDLEPLAAETGTLVRKGRDALSLKDKPSRSAEY